jgi:hypothetical protein
VPEGTRCRLVSHSISILDDMDFSYIRINGVESRSLRVVACPNKGMLWSEDVLVAR